MRVPPSDGRYRRIGVGLLLACALVAGGGCAPDARAAHPAETHINNLIPGAQRVGAGRLTWFGIHAYDAALYAENARFVENAPLALELTYARNFKGVAIAERSIGEIRKLGLASEAEAVEWLDVLTGLFPDVRSGDRLAGVQAATGPAQFFHNGRAIGGIANERLKRAFFAIWLDPRTSAPDLRNRLIGTTSASK